ncbi:hypothetical protein [Algoriphagus hitonicola]|uniref:Uncharacterized protein n=1 Tax=Algoriphagus hitonicola TaxID=435880 RepID=A0A1I2NGK7_9BACT|nr:hypothetical protein [Algoriphagus hitonicola]SFG01989.1 hypothetical protein SAMN04487988_10161 [Algoriphagus hitonicola]
MNDRLKNEHDPLFKWIQEASPKSPHEDILRSVMSRLEEKKSITTYEPIISKKQWGMIASIFAVVILLSFFQSPIESIWTKMFVEFPELTLPSISFSFATPSLPEFVKTGIMMQATLAFITLSVAVILIKNKLSEMR